MIYVIGLLELTKATMSAKSLKYISAYDFVIGIFKLTKATMSTKIILLIMFVIGISKATVQQKRQWPKLKNSSNQ